MSFDLSDTNCQSVQMSDPDAKSDHILDAALPVFVRHGFRKTSMADIARAVSYTNLHQFYKVFYRSCAMSPGEYRRYYTPAAAR